MHDQVITRDLKIDWAHYASMQSIFVWEAVLLSLDINPRLSHFGNNKIEPLQMPGASAKLNDEVDKRMRVVLVNIEEGRLVPFTPKQDLKPKVWKGQNLKLIHIATFIGIETNIDQKIMLRDFVIWAKNTVKWPNLPEKFLELESEIQAISDNTEISLKKKEKDIWAKMVGAIIKLGDTTKIDLSKPYIKASAGMITTMANDLKIPLSESTVAEKLKYVNSLLPCPLDAKKNKDM